MVSMLAAFFFTTSRSSATLCNAQPGTPAWAELAVSLSAAAAAAAAVESSFPAAWLGARPLGAQPGQY